MIFITLGEPLSVNVELLAATLTRHQTASCPQVIIGSYWHWADQLKRLGYEDFLIPQVRMEQLEQLCPGIFFLDIGGVNKPAELLSLEERGVIASQSLYQAREIFGSLKEKNPEKRYAFLTASIDKQTVQQAGFSFPGQTEFFEDVARKKGIMVLAAPKLIVGLATNHVALKDVSFLMTQQLILEKLNAFSDTLKTVFIQKEAVIGVCGLNPHAGDGGMFGMEEIEVLSEALALFNQQSSTLQAKGPISADTIFHQALQGRYDAVLALYHDQGLAPLKTVFFHEAVNITGGLPFLRCAPDHGPARDLFLKKEARIDSFEYAYLLCKNYLTQR